MALIKCPECGNEISDTASSCPRCGHPILKKQTKGFFHRLFIALGRGIKGFKQGTQEYQKDKTEFLSTHFECPTCNEWLSNTINVCPHCGRPFKDEKALSEFLQQERIHTDNIQQAEKVSSALWMIWVAIIIGVIIIFAMFVPLKGHQTLFEIISKQ